MTGRASPGPPSSRVLLIDLDNCPKELAELPNELANFTRIVACYGVNEPRLSVSLVRALAPAIHEGRLEFVGMELRGKNAADFGLAFWAGRLLERLPAETEFVILSRDNGLEHVVNLLRREHRAARRGVVHRGQDGRRPGRRSGRGILHRTSAHSAAPPQTPQDPAERHTDFLSEPRGSRRRAGAGRLDPPRLGDVRQRGDCHLSRNRAVDAGGCSPAARATRDRSTSPRVGRSQARPTKQPAPVRLGFIGHGHDEVAKLA